MKPISPPGLDQLSIGILTWHRPATLSYALKSYARAGLLKCVGEVTLFANAADPREAALARTHGLGVIERVDNVGIGPAFAALAEAATQPYFLFLENDWPCIEPAATAARRITTGMDLVSQGQADAVRLRHRSCYGHPLYSRDRCQGHEQEPANLPHLLDAVHWHKTPHRAFPDHICQRAIEDENWYFANSQHAAYTNNPCLYRTDFARAGVASRGMKPGFANEDGLQDWWRSQDLTVAQGEGLFMHRDPGKEWRRAGRIVKSWFQRGRLPSILRLRPNNRLSISRTTSTRSSAG